MSKSREEIKDLQRRLVLLDQLDGPVAVFADGVFVVRGVQVSNPESLIEAAKRGPLHFADLRRGSWKMESPIAVDTQLVAQAERDLRALETSTAWMELARESHRLFRRFGTLDRAWIEEHRRVLGSLRAALSGSRAPSSDLFPEWFDRLLDVVALIHGEKGSRELAAAARASFGHGGRSRAAARSKLERLILCLAGQLSQSTGPALADAARRIAQLHPGRAMPRRVLAILREVLELPGPKIDELPAGSGDCVTVTREVGSILISALPSTRSPEYRDRLLTALARLGLLLEGPRPLEPSDVELVHTSVDKLQYLSGKKLSFADALGLLSLKLGDEALEAAAAIRAAGVPLEELKTLVEHGYANELELISGDAEIALAYCSWIARLAPHYKKLGLELSIPANVFKTIATKKQQELAVLAVCLMQRATPDSPAAADHAVATLDATLGLFRSVPGEAARIVTTLAAAPAGAGARLMPEVAAWLGDDALLDRFVHLSELIGEPPVLSRRLRRDFDCARRLEGERAHLASLPARTDKQNARLTAIEREHSNAADPSWTRRRLEERNQELAARAYTGLLETACRRLVAETWRISIEAITREWRDAIRFFFAAFDNQELLATLLRLAAAHPGANVTRALPKNQEWIARAAEKIDVEAWLAPRSREVQISGRGKCVLAFEEDPIQVLRMGIPFGTCLALDKGCNAPSTVINAADANKRVAYLRDHRGIIFARKLLAISKTWKLIGYCVYSSVTGEADQDVNHVFAEFCRDLSADIRAERSSSGEPEQIHQGFWYDDGAVRFDDAESTAPASVAQFCQSAGVEIPRRISAELQAEAELVAARAAGDRARAVAVMHKLDWAYPPAGLAWIFDGLDTPSALRWARKDRKLLRAAVYSAAVTQGATAAIKLASRIESYHVADALTDFLALIPHQAANAFELVRAANTHAPLSPQTEDTHFGQAVLNALAGPAAMLDLERLFELFDRAEELVAKVSWLRERLGLIEVGLATYRRAPDPEVVLSVLASTKSSSLSRRAGLAIAAKYPLAPGAAGAPLPWLPGARTPLLPSPRAVAVLEKFSRHDAALAADPRWFAAIVRQSAGLPKRTPATKPNAAPFEAFADLALQLPELESFLEPYASPALEPAQWKPGRWELHHHRRYATSWRKKLGAIERRGGEQAKVAGSWLAHLGPVEQRPAGQADAAQHEEACARLIKVFAGGEDRDFGGALELVLQETRDPASIEALLGALADRDEPATRAIEDEKMKTAIEGFKSTVRMRPELIARLWRRETLRPALAEAMLDPINGRSLRGLANVRAAGRRLGLNLEDLVQVVAETNFERRVYDLSALDDPLLTRELISAAVRANSSRTSLVEFYKILPADELALSLLRELGEPGEPDAALESVFRAAQENWEEHRHRRGWLEARINRAPTT